MHQVIYNMLVTKYLDKLLFYYIKPWSLTLAYLAWLVREYHLCILKYTPGQAVFGRDTIVNLTSIIDCLVVSS